MSHIVKKKVPFWCRIAATLSCIFIKVYIWTLRITTHGQDTTIEFLKNLPSGAVILIWHDSILLMPLLQSLSHIKRTGILISNSKDGDVPTEIAKKFTGVEVVRVKHTARATAVKEGIELLHNNQNLVITPDGPRGPRHKIKDGSIFAANAAQAPIIPIVWAASKQVSLHSWDRFKIPLPFSKVHLSFLPEIYPHLEQDSSDIKKELEMRMENEEERLVQLYRKIKKGPMEVVN